MVPARDRAGFNDKVMEILVTVWLYVRNSKGDVECQSVKIQRYTWRETRSSVAEARRSSTL